MTIQQQEGDGVKQPGKYQVEQHSWEQFKHRYDDIPFFSIELMQEEQAGEMHNARGHEEINTRWHQNSKQQHQHQQA